MLVNRPLMLRGDHVSAGRTVDVSPSEAALLLESGRASLVDVADMVAVREAVHADTAAILRREKSNQRNRN